MGLLTDPSAGQGKLIKLLLKYYSKLCLLLYLGGVVYFALLASTHFNGGTYISENALLPGLVKSEFRDEGSARLYHEELLDEMKKYDNSIPYPWLLAKFKQIGLDTYTHNFTLNYPLGRKQKFTGKNVYGILRAPRASSTESVVLSVPYRPPLSIHSGTAPSIAIMLSFAKFATDKKYWAKDIIFLITEHEQLGMQAWLEAYHGVSCGRKNILISGDMNGRAGAIQAAINLEFHDIEIGTIDLKIEGLNGQLPNLDLFNLAAKISNKEGIQHTFKGKQPKKHKDPFEDWKYSAEILMSMISTQATGVPNGNHGLFYRLGIQAVTMEGFAPTSPKQNRAGFYSQGRILEGIFRSLNNLLERFHQSFFFYLLASSDRYISIGLYMPAIGVLAATLFIKAYAKWCQLHDTPQASSDTKEENASKSPITPKTKDELEKQRRTQSKYQRMSLDEWQELFDKQVSRESRSQQNEINLGYVGLVLALSHCAGLSLKDLPDLFTQFGLHYLGWSGEFSIYAGLGLVAILTVVLPALMGKPCAKSITLLNVLALLELGTTLVCIAMYNVSLGMFLAVVYVPLVLVINPSECGMCNTIQRILWIFAHPFIVLTILVFISTYLNFSSESLLEIAYRAYGASQHALTFSIVDSIIYGNWLYNVITTVCLSNWICFWFVCGPKFSVNSSNSVTSGRRSAKKNN